MYSIMMLYHPARLSAARFRWDQAFVGCVPVQFAKADYSKSHVHASKISRGRQFSLRDLVRPTAFFHTLACEVE
jgi:hypothetical protein